VADREYFYVNQKIQVGYPDRQDDWYASSVSDVNSKEIHITVPIKETRSLILFRNEIIEVSFFEEMARYVFPTRVIRRIQENIPLYILDKPSAYKRIQLREYFRVPVDIQVGYAHLPRGANQPVFAWADCLDLSGGGLRLAIAEGLEKDDKLILTFTLPFKEQPEELTIYGLVERVWKEEESRTRQVAIRFVNITQKQIDLITRHLFAVMLELKRLKLETV